MTNNCQKKKKKKKKKPKQKQRQKQKQFKEIATRTNFFLGLFTTFKVIEIVIFKNMYFKNITKVAVILDLIPLCKRPFTS